jgi:hypothetical protein
LRPAADREKQNRGETSCAEAFCELHGKPSFARDYTSEATGLPHGIPTSLSLDTYSIWQNGFTMQSSQPKFLVVGCFQLFWDRSLAEQQSGCGRGAALRD